MKMERKQIIQTDGKRGDKTMETKLTKKRVRFLSNIESVLEQISTISNEESTTMDNVVLRDLIWLDNSASSGNSDQEGRPSTGDGFVVDNPITFAQCLN
jgi:hypothetical protein